MDNGQLKKGYKRTEVGVIPEEWDCPELSEITDIIDGDRGVNYPCQSDFSHDGSCLFLNAGNVTKEGFKFFECAFINKEKDLFLSKGKLKRGDIVLTTRGTVGNLAFFDETVEFEQIRINSGMVIVRIAKENLNNKYLYMLLRSRIVGTQIDRVVFGSAQPQLTVKVIKKFSIPIPSSQEQRAIATALSDVDALIAALDKLIAKKLAIKTATMQQLLTGKKRLPGFDKGKRYKQTELGMIPEDWNVYALGEIGKFKNGLNKDSQAFGHGSPFVNLMDVFGVNSILSTEKLGLVACSNFERDTYDLRCGDVIFVRSSVKPSGVGLTAVIEKDLPGTVYSGFLIRFRDGGFIDIGFKKYCFYEEGFRKTVIGSSSVSANTNINQESLKRLLILLPSTIAEQAAIATVLSHIDAEITALEARRNKTQSIKQGMMQELLTGRTRLI